MNNFSSKLKYRLSFYFHNPLFYVTAIIFFVFVCLNFFIKNQFFTGSGSTDLLLYFSAVPYISILIIPALCYKLSFSIYDDFLPLTAIKKHLLQFITIFILYTILIFMLIIPVFFVCIFGSVDAGQIFCSLLCLIFYGGAIISLCVLINELFNNSITAFIVSAVILAIFNSIHLLCVYVSLPVIVSEALKYLSFAWHFDAAGKGIVDTRDILWLSGTAVLFLLLSCIVTKIKAGKIFPKKEKITLWCYCLLCILVMLNGTRYYKRFDLSQNKTYTLSKYSKQLTSQLEEPLKITYYRSASLSRLYPQIRDVTDFLNEFASQNKKISMTVKDPDKSQETKDMLGSWGISSQQMQSIKQNSREYIQVYSAIVMEYKGNIEVIPFIISAETLEYDLDGRLGYLITGKLRVVNTIIGNGLTYTSEDDYNNLVPWLNSQGFVCNQLYPEDPYFAEELEHTTGPLLIIGDSEINVQNSIAIENYILSNKGNAFFALSPYNVAILDDWSMLENKSMNLVELLENWGVNFTNNIVADVACANITLYSQEEEQSDFVQGNVTTKVLNYPLWPDILQQTNSKLGLTLFWPVKLELAENAKPYLITTPASYYYTADRSNRVSVIQTNPFDVEQLKISDKPKASQIVAAEIEGTVNGYYNYGSTDNAHIIVLSDPYFVNSLTLGYSGNNIRNFEFLTDSLLKLSGEYDLAKLHERTGRNTLLYKISDVSVFYGMQRLVYICLFAVVPLIIILCGALIMILQRRKYRNDKEDK